MRKLIAIIIVSFPVLAFGQSAERQVIGSTGGFATTNSIQISSTVGETVVSTGTSNSIILTQGFQQPHGSAVGIDEPELGISIEAFPNPTSSILILDFNVSRQQIIEISLYDALGKSYTLPQSKLNISGNMQHQIDLSLIAAGNYFIRLRNPEGTLDKSIKIQKVD